MDDAQSAEAPAAEKGERMLTLNFGPRAMQDIEAMAKQGNCSVSAVIQDSLATLKYLTEQEIAGERILLERPRWGVKIFGLSVFGKTQRELISYDLTPAN